MSSKEWEEVEIQNICIVKRGASPRPIHDYISDKGIPWVKIADATYSNSRFISKTKEFIKKEGKEKSKYIQKGTLILSNSATPGIPKIMKIDACVHDGWLIIDSFKGVLKEFMYYMFIYERDKLVRLSTGSVFNNLKTDIVKRYKVNLPKLNDQKVIVKILSILDDKIELNNQINKNLEAMAQAIFKHWFIDFEFPNENGEPYKSSGGEMINSELGAIPKEWVVIPFKEIIKISSGKRPQEKKNERNKKFNTPLIGASSVMGYVSEILYIKPILVIGRVGTHGIVQRIKEKSWPSDNTLVIQPEHYEYTYQILKNINYQSLNRGSTQPLITQTDIKKYKIVFPKNNLLRDFEKRIRCLFQLINKNKEENKVLSRIRDTLIPKLMSGEIRIL